MKISQYRKFIWAALGAGATALGSVVTDGTITPAEWYFIASTTLAAVGVVLTPNAPKGLELPRR